MDHCTLALALTSTLALALALTGTSITIIIRDVGWLGLGRGLVVGAAESFKGAPLDGPVVAGADVAPFDGDQGG